MKVILLQEVENLGEGGEIVNVKNGFGRNYLIPRGLARLATPSTVKAWEEERRQASRKLAQKQGDAQNLANELAKMDIVLRAKVGEENRIFGTITSAQLVEALAAQGVTVDRRKVELAEDVRTLGVYTASVKLHPEVTAALKFRVEPEGGVAPAPAAPQPAAE
ncbi:MAG: 50S ribosomal protein L9 [Rhodothermales bacterium]|nr:50S ribosomal protein L9 [Rhodothermales bacterium]